jgi:hypothetical protein
MYNICAEFLFHVAYYHSVQQILKLCLALYFHVQHSFVIVCVMQDSFMRINECFLVQKEKFPVTENNRESF